MVVMEFWLGSFVTFSGSGPVLLNPIVLRFSKGGGDGSGPSGPPSGSAHERYYLPMPLVFIMRVIFPGKHHLTNVMTKSNLFLIKGNFFKRIRIYVYIAIDVK